MKIYPDQIPIFPLSGVIYFPKTNLPLNIFEKRYLNLVNDAYNKNKFMGMVQSQREGESIYQIGCLGKISEYQKIKDGRILINLVGVSRFKILEETSNNKLYREFRVDYGNFNDDIKDDQNEVDTKSLMEKTRIFFKKNGLLLNWKEFEKLEQLQKINTLAMIAPVSNEEKQKLLEAITTKDRIKALESIISFYLHETGSNNQTIQ